MTALESAKEQLTYWQRECEIARARQNAPRVVCCERFIEQCEAVIAALHLIATDG